jgi:hypothetical protein
MKTLFDIYRKQAVILGLVEALNIINGILILELMVRIFI